MTDAEIIALNTRYAGAYSADRYGEQAWNTAAAELLKIIRPDDQQQATVEAIMMSKHMRYAADMYADSDDQITGREIVRFIAANPKHFTDKALAELVAAN